jgi:hypothetical protein
MVGAVVEGVDCAGGGAGAAGVVGVGDVAVGVVSVGDSGGGTGTGTGGTVGVGTQMPTTQSIGREWPCGVSARLAAMPAAEMLVTAPIRRAIRDMELDLFPFLSTWRLSYRQQMGRSAYPVRAIPGQAVPFTTATTSSIPSPSPGGFPFWAAGCSGCLTSAGCCS